MDVLLPTRGHAHLHHSGHIGAAYYMHVSKHLYYREVQAGGQGYEAVTSSYLHDRRYIGVVDAARRDVCAEEHDSSRGAKLGGHVPGS